MEKKENKEKKEGGDKKTGNNDEMCTLALCTNKMNFSRLTSSYSSSSSSFFIFLLLFLLLLFAARHTDVATQHGLNLLLLETALENEAVAAVDSAARSQLGQQKAQHMIRRAVQPICFVERKKKKR